MTKEIIDSALKDMASEAHKVYGDKLKEVILFGSCARGDYENGSDVDIMILVDVEDDEVNAEMKKIHPIVDKLDMKYEYELLFAPIIQSYTSFNYWLEVTPFYKNIVREGIRYA